MGYLPLLSLAVVFTLFAGCAEFPTSYSRIEPNKVRLLDFIYEPAEAAPGDTVLLKAVFAGKEPAARDLVWRMSKKLIINQYSRVAAVDTVPLEMLPEACRFSDRTSCVAFRFVIPKTVIAESPIVPDAWWTAIPEYYRTQIPPALLALSKSDVLALLENPSPFDGLSTASPEGFQAQMLPALLQCFTVPVRIYCTIPNDHVIIGGYSVRYNSRFASLSGTRIPVNRNPRIDSMGIYIVHKGNLAAFDPAAGKYAYDYVSIDDSGYLDIPVDDACSYFMATVTGAVDTTLSIDAALGSGTPLIERHLLQWYREFDEKEMVGVSPYDLMDIGETQFAGGRYLSRLYPSANKAIATCTVWLEVSDQFLNEYYRPVGSTLKELRMRFSYK